MPDQLDVIEELQTYLVAEGVAQLPATAPSLTVPSVWLFPRDGEPAPRKSDAGGQLENATVTLVDVRLGAANSLEPWIERAFVDVVVRARHNSTAKLIHRQIRDLLAPQDLLGGRKMWTMGELLVERSDVWKGDQPAGGTPQFYRRTQGFVFDCRRKALAGLPYAP